MPDDIEILPKSRLIHVKAEFDFVLPETASTEEIEEWVTDAIGLGGGIDTNNPLINAGLDILQGEVLLTDMAKHVKPTVVPHEKPGSYTVKRELIDEPYVGPSESDQFMAFYNARKAER